MRGEDPLKFLPLNEDAIYRSEGRVSEWVESWWTSGNRGRPCLDKQLRLLTPEDWFELRNISGPRLWAPPPAAMETVVELFSEDRMVNPHCAHVFVVPRLMTHLWRRAMGKDADVMFKIEAGSPFWPLSMHEPLYVIIILPLFHVPNYSGPWVQHGSRAATELTQTLERGFSKPSDYGREKFHDLALPMPSLRKGPESWSRDLLRKFLDDQRHFPPVSQCVVRELLSRTSSRSFSHSDGLVGRKRRRTGVRGPRDGGKAEGKIRERKRRRSSYGDPIRM